MVVIQDVGGVCLSENGHMEETYQEIMFGVLEYHID
jgi:hypothetical protein